MNPVALITGASRGIGRGIALALANIGYDLIVNYATNEAAAGQTAASAVSLGGEHGRRIRARICRADISLSKDRQALIDFARANFGRIDLLVNNAGIAPSVRADILEASEESFDRLISTNVKGPYFLTQLAAKWMVELTGISGAERHSSLPEKVDQPGEAPRAYQPKIITISSSARMPHP
jgi:NAD(P)-dependent dehydrogenase (short-subunit alcohol dehydrogenase family)